ncbi:exported hypothetical protein [Candidatus Sulfotelmatomonas gaucii]|uniref:Lipoprotein n=1 Tax=Candidatus Sulfuritelmatomonas gaucii TaxID=2043161 RepID=A0A2N9M091_9BACT|nr:exported hypothetical protein [Candidatus Sulfotelmatomonas gaucii]
MKNRVKIQLLATVVLLSAGWWLGGCKSAPELTQAQAKTMIQAKYDQTPPAPLDITLASRGMTQGILAKYWVETKRYPNGYWGDFTLTPDGKKLVKLASAGDLIQWRPDSPTDPRFSVVVETLANVRHQFGNLGDIETVGETRVVNFTDSVDLSPLPQPLQGIAQTPGNMLASTRQATFVLTNGAWTLQSIE